MFKVFEDTFRDNFLKFFFQSYLLIERSLRIRSQNQLTVREMFLLGLLARLKTTQNHTVMNAAKYLQVSPPIISTSVKSLIRKGYLNKVLNLEDNRIYFLELTEKGLTSNHNSFQFSDRLIAKSTKKINPLDMLTLRKIFQLVENIIDEENQLLDEEEAKIPVK